MARWSFRTRMLRDITRTLGVQWLRTGWPMIIVLAMVRTFTQAPEEPQPAAAQTFDGRIAPTPESLALVVFARELTDDKLVLCLAIDGKDASAAVIAGIGQPSNTAVPSSQCGRGTKSNRGGSPQVRTTRLAEASP